MRARQFQQVSCSRTASKSACEGGHSVELLAVPGMSIVLDVAHVDIAEHMMTRSHSNTPRHSHALDNMQPKRARNASAYEFSSLPEQRAQQEQQLQQQRPQSSSRSPASGDSWLKRHVKSAKMKMRSRLRLFNDDTYGRGILPRLVPEPYEREATSVVALATARAPHEVIRAQNLETNVERVMENVAQRRKASLTVAPTTSALRAVNDAGARRSTPPIRRCSYNPQALISEHIHEAERNLMDRQKTSATTSYSQPNIDSNDTIVQWLTDGHNHHGEHDAVWSSSAPQLSLWLATALYSCT